MISSDPSKAAEELEKWASGLEQRARSYAELQQRLDDTSATESTQDGSIRVTVDANGVPTELMLAERVRGVDPRQLSAEIMTCMRRAQAKLRQQVQELVHTTVPAGDEPANNILAQYEQRFPEVEPTVDNGYQVTREHDFRPDEDDDPRYLR